MKKKLLLGIFVFGIIFFALVIKTQAITTLLNSDNQAKDQLNLTLSSTSHKILDLSLTPHEPIEIINDDNFTDYGFAGSGTSGEPYIIENYDITTTNSRGIYVNDTTKHFVIRSCYVDADSKGILISYVAEGTASIINNTCNNNLFGIYLYSSSGSTLTNNICTNNDFGISMWSSSGSTLTNNTCNNNLFGIYLSSSSGSTLTNNSCTNNRYGIYLRSSSGSTLTNNTCNNNDWDGISLRSSSGSTLTNNSCYNDGFYFYESTVEDYLNYEVENNCVNGKKLGFYKNLDKITLSEPLYGQLILINCTEMEVCNQELSNTSRGLSLSWCENATLTNNTCTNNDYGIRLRSSSGSTLTNNTCNNNLFGIYLSSSSGSTLTNNTCNNNDWDGIYLYFSSGATLTNNTCNNNGLGIYLFSSSGAVLTNNTCSNNGDVDSNVHHNQGIHIRDSKYCLLTYNLLQENIEYGIFVESDSKNNIIHHNIFIDNNLGGTSQAYDSGINNTWYEEETKEGNYWSDWNKKKRYLIDGNANATDSYPLNENLERINFGYTLVIPALILVAILLKRKRNNYSRL